MHKTIDHSVFRPVQPNVPDASVSSDLRIAVIVPCYNESITIGKVVADFRTALPDSEIYVYDNNSTDGTSEAARRAGAIVRTERLQGKGNVVRRMFADIDADVYVLIDGDATYTADKAPEMIRRLFSEGLDMITGNRISEELAAYRVGHRLGNKLLTGIVSFTFGNTITDMLSGYRVLSRRYVKSFPAMAKGFEIETELTVHALELRMPIIEVDTVYLSRPEGSISKLSTYKDGIRILRMIGRLVKDERPFLFFSSIALLLILISLGFGWSVLVEFVATGLVPRLPTAVLAMGMAIIAALSFLSGIVLDSVALSRREARRFEYLKLSSPRRMDAKAWTLDQS